MTKRAIFEAVAVLAALIFAGLWLRGFWQPAPVGVPVVAEQVPAIAHVAKETVECAKLQVYAPAAKKKLGLPAGPGAVVSAVKVKSDLRPHTVSTTVDTTTGEVTTYDTRGALPWAAVSQRGSIGLAYGYLERDPTWRIEARQALLDIKALQVGAVASYDMPRGEPFVGLTVSYRW